MQSSIKGRLIDIGDAQLNVVTEGMGQPILVPTGCGTAYYRQTFAETLCEQYQLVYIEMRGTGFSTGSVGEATFATLADDIDAVREALGIPQAIVMGHSNHGSIVLEYAHKYPNNTAATISVASTPDFIRIFPLGGTTWEARATEAQKAMRSTLQAEFDALDLHGMSADEIALCDFRTLTPLAWMDPTIDLMPIFGGVPVGIADYLQIEDRAQKNWNFIPKLSAIATPVLVMSGRYDHFCPLEIWLECIDQLRDARLEVFENSAHNPQYEESEKFGSVLAGFLAEI